MAKPRRSNPEPYVEGPRKQMTIAWKERVLEVIANNKREGRQPANLAQLAKRLKGGRGADKRGIYVTFDLEAQEPQMASAYVDEICNVLGIGPPMVESFDDAQLKSQLEIFRSISAEERALILDPDYRKLVMDLVKKRR